MNRKLLWSLPLLGLMLGAAAAHAAFPRLLNYQGLLLDPGGDPVPNGNYALTFRLYPVRTGGTALFTESHPAVAVTQGTFSVNLGQSLALPLSAFADSCFLGTQLATDPEFAPRVLLTLAPFAARAAGVEDGAVAAAAIANGTVVRSLNGIQDAATLAAGSNISITPSAGTLTIAATGVGLTLPFSGSVSTPTAPAFSVTNTGPGGGGDFRLNGTAGAGMPALLAQHQQTAGVAVQGNGMIRSGTTGYPGIVRVTQNSSFGSLDAQMMSTTTGGRFDLQHLASNGQFTAEARLAREIHLFATEGPTFFNGIEMTAFQSNGDRHRLQLVQGSQVIRLAAGTSTADSSVQLPAGAITAPEVADEPGVVANGEGAASVSLTGGLDVLRACTITAPTAGFVLVLGTAQLRATHLSGTLSSVNFGVSDQQTSLPGNQDVGWILPSALTSGTYDLPASVHGLFAVTAGTHDFWLNAQELSGTVSAFDLQLTAVFIASAYGTVDPTLRGGVDDALAVARGPLGPAELATQSAAHQRWLDERARLELDELRERVAALERERAEARTAGDR